jgi:hypothetical protein
MGGRCRQPVRATVPKPRVVTGGAGVNPGMGDVAGLRVAESNPAPHFPLEFPGLPVADIFHPGFARSPGLPKSVLKPQRGGSV